MFCVKYYNYYISTSILSENFSQSTINYNIIVYYTWRDDVYIRLNYGILMAWVCV